MSDLQTTQVGYAPIDRPIAYETPAYPQASPAQEVAISVPVEETKEAEPLLPFEIPANAVELSSGVYVMFNKLPKSMSTDLTIKTFNNVNLDKKGNVLSDNMSTKEQISMAKSISEYHTTLISQGVTLVGNVSDYKKLLDLPDNWFVKLLRSGLVNDKYYSQDNSDDEEFLFLRYYGFANDEDWALLSSRTLNT